MNANATPSSEYALPRQMEALLASASRFLKSKGQNELVALLANGRIQVEEGANHDNWDGGQTGHGVLVYVPEALFHLSIERVSEYATELHALLNKFAEVPHEYVAWARFCLDLSTVSSDWREESGALLAPPTLAAASAADTDRLWGDGAPRVFLSHRAAFKSETKGLKDELANYGAASFVAHEDIEPTRDWQTEIERALASMDVLVAVLATGFNGSYWTNQEVGVALGRGVPVVTLRVTEDPKGFIGASQAVSGYSKTPVEWAKDLIAVFSTYERLCRPLQLGLVREWERTASFPEGIRIMNLLDVCKTIPSDLLARIETAYAANGQLNKSAGVNRKYHGFISRMKAKGRVTP